MELTIEEKRDRVFGYCNNIDCARDCKLKNWAGKSKSSSGENCLIIDDATEEELDKALELINNTKIKPLEDSKIEKHKLICEQECGSGFFTRTEDETKDMVNHPSHYTQGKFECIEVIEEITKPCNGFEAYLIGTILKYLWRWKFKNGLEDLKKARWYLDKLIEKVGEE